MRYFTAEELKNSERDHAHEIVEHCVGKSVRDRYSLTVFLRYHDRYFRERANTSVLDVGVGSGVFPKQIADEGFREISGADLDTYLAAEYAPLLREFRALDLATEPLPWPDARFDMVSAWCVLPHLENPFHAAREIARVIKPGGIFIFSAPHLGSKPSRDYFYRNGDFKSYRETNNHITLFTPGVIRKTMLRDFELVATEYHFRPKIFNGLRGRIRRFLWDSASGLQKKMLAKRWAYNAMYILRKRI